MKKLLFLLAALVLFSACDGKAASPASGTTQPPSLPEPTPSLDRETLIGTWQGSGNGNGTFLILREDGSGAILSLVPADGGAFTEDFYLGLHIVWQLDGDALTWQVLPAVLPNGAVYSPESEPSEKTAAPGNGILSLSDGENTEFFIKAEEPVWYTVSAYATALADWLIGPDQPAADILYDEFYNAFASHDENE